MNWKLNSYEPFGFWLWYYLEKSSSYYYASVIYWVLQRLYIAVTLERYTVLKNSLVDAGHWGAYSYCHSRVFKLGWLWSYSIGRWSLMDLISIMMVWAAFIARTIAPEVLKNICWLCLLSLDWSADLICIMYSHHTCQSISGSAPFVRYP